MLCYFLWQNLLIQPKEHNLHRNKPRIKKQIMVLHLFIFFASLPQSNVLDLFCFHFFPVYRVLCDSKCRKSYVPWPIDLFTLVHTVCVLVHSWFFPIPVPLMDLFTYFIQFLSHPSHKWAHRVRIY